MRTLATTVLILGVGVAAVLASAPFGGDDTGFVPPSKDARACQGRAAMNAGALFKCLARCHVGAATKAFAGGSSDDELCEAGCLVAYQDEALAIVASGQCPACLDQTGLGARIRDFMDVQNGAFYCAGATPLAVGGDTDAGFVPPDAGTLHCESRVVHKAGSFGRCLFACQRTAAAQAFAGTFFDEDDCEARCQDKLVAAVGSGTCPPCLGPLPAVGQSFRDFVDGNDARIYCAASASGAFVD